MAPTARIIVLHRGNRFLKWIAGLAILGALVYFGYRR